jgi:hypothetical protein
MTTSKAFVMEYFFVRSARIADYVGHLMTVAYRHRLIPLLTSEESSRAAAQAAIRAATRNRLIKNRRDTVFDK